MAVAHVVGGLSLDEGRLFRSHLLECTACRARVGELRAIAHDLADVERVERRERAARRTETKAREGKEPELPEPPARRLNIRTTVMVSVGLVLLMALSSWNFLLRGRVQNAENAMALLRQSATVLRDGDEWQSEPVSTSVSGQVNVLGQDLVVMVDGLVDRTYALYLLDANGEVIHRDVATATNGMLYEFLDDAPAVESAQELQLIRSNDAEPMPTGPQVFLARRAGLSDALAPEAVGGRRP